jgi:signal transduction histidine kinase
MGSILQQVFSLLTTDTGNLTYHLVLAFSIAGALQAAFTYSRTGDPSKGRRMILGLSMLLLIQLALFVSSGLVWQGLIDAGNVLPPLDRAAILLSLILIIWLWAFPNTQRAADGAALLIGLLTITMLALGITWWSGQDQSAGFNGSLPDMAATFYALVLVAIGVVLMLIRRPAGWGVGLAMLGLILAGHLANLTMPVVEGDYSGPLRLALMAAFPLLLVLPQRFPALVVGSAPIRSSTGRSKTSPVATDIELTSELLELALETDINKAYPMVTSIVARLMRADLCVLVIPPQDSGDMLVAEGYDSVNEHYFQNLHLENHKAPVLASTLRRGQSLRLPATSTSPDLSGLARTLNLEKTGDLLAASLKPAGSEYALLGILLLSPYSHRSWDENDEAQLNDIAGLLVRLLQRNEELLEQQKELQQARMAAEHAQSVIERARKERENLLEQLSTLSASAEKDRSQLKSLAAMLAAQEVVHKTIDNLQEENEKLQEVISQEPGEPSVESEQFEGELRLALQEIALLKASLSEADQKILKLQNMQNQTLSGELSNQQVEVIASLAQELRQPMSSILGYTDFLLGETVGILGALQRKFLERVRVATERMDRLVDDLIQVTTVERSKFQIISQAVDLNAVIDEAIAETSDQLRKKNIALRVDMPEHLPDINAERDSLEQVVINLLKNAGAATPYGGDILLHARIESSDGEQDYVLLQVSDSGEGIDPDDVPRVFSRLYGTSDNQIRGLGKTGIGMSIVKTMVESAGGRIWVDSQPGIGSTFSVLFPISQDNASSNGRRRSKV